MYNIEGSKYNYYYYLIFVFLFFYFTLFNIISMTEDKFKISFLLYTLTIPIILWIFTINLIPLRFSGHTVIIKSLIKLFLHYYITSFYYFQLFYNRILKKVLIAL